MNLLLDTHVWLWSLLEPERLRPAVQAALADAGTRRWLSPLSAWEAHLLIERGRLAVDRPAAEWVRAALAAAPIEEAPLTAEIAIESRALATTQRDPVDRFLAATARVLDLTLVTADRELLAMRALRTLNAASQRRVPAARRR